MRHCCPCCGQELRCPGLLWLPLAGLMVRTEDQFAVWFSVRESAVLNELWQGYVANGVKPVPMRKLIEATYKNDVNGGPDSAQLCVYQFVHTLKRKLKPLGFKLVVRDCTVTLCQVENANAEYKTKPRPVRLRSRWPSNGTDVGQLPGVQLRSEAGPR